MRKIRICSLFVAVMFLLTASAGIFAGCEKQGQEEKPRETDVVRVVSDGSKITLKNGRVSLQFDLSNGNLVRFRPAVSRC